MTIIGPILALDLATQTGFCVGRPDATHPVFGEFKIPPQGDQIGRFAAIFLEWFDGIMEFYEPELMVFEAPILPKMTNPQTVRKLNGLAVLAEWSATQKYKIKCAEARASSVKKYFTGTGRAQKEDTVAACRKYGWAVKSDDAADACALWAYSVALYAKEHASRFALGPIGARELF